MKVMLSRSAISAKSIWNVRTIGQKATLFRSFSVRAWIPVAKRLLVDISGAPVNFALAAFKNSDGTTVVTITNTQPFDSELNLEIDGKDGCIVGSAGISQYCYYLIR